jgi:amino acid transporter
MAIPSNLIRSKAFRGLGASALILLGTLSVLTPAILPAAAIAQTGSEPPPLPTPPNPQKPDNPPTLMMILFGVVILGAIFAVNVMPSKRGHQD